MVNAAVTVAADAVESASSIDAVVDASFHVLVASVHQMIASSSSAIVAVCTVVVPLFALTSDVNSMITVSSISSITSCTAPRSTVVVATPGANTAVVVPST